MQHRLEKKIADIIANAGAESLLVAVSGGADSVALLRICHSMAQRHRVRIEAANCNFHLRGPESDRDSEFTARLCERLGVRLHRLDYDVARYQESHPGLSIEMACRQLRYADFHRIARSRSLERIAVAHNADDDIETMMLNMLRGSGSRGLRGMDIDNGSIIRPLLTTHRAEIEAYLKETGQDFITDSSNLTSDFRRNFIRREVMPLLELRWPGARKALSRTVAIMKEDAEIVENHYRRQLQRLSAGDNSLLVYSEEVTPGTILRFIEPFGGNSSTAEEIAEARHSAFARRTWRLGPRHEAALERDRLVIIDADDASDHDDVRLEWELFPADADTMAMVKSCAGHFSAYLPEGPDAYTLRTPRAGDRIAPLGMKGKRLVSDVISDAKLDRQQKSRVRVLARRRDGEIIWVTGLKRSRHDLVSLQSRAIFKASARAGGPTEESTPQ